MSNDKKVVSLRPGSASAPALPAAFADLYQRSWDYLADHIQKLLDSADDALFELADRALNASEQNLYFEAMREIRVHRRRLEEEFKASLLEPFYTLVGVSNSAQGNIQALELLDYDDMEEQLAVEGMANKANKRFGQELANIGKSLEVWCAANGSKVQLSEKQLPLAPLAICDAFAKGARSLDINIKPKLVLLKLFDRYVVSEFSGLYAVVEHALKSAGLYVAAEAIARTQDKAVSAPAEQKEGPAGSEFSIESTGTLFDVLKSLLSVPVHDGGDGKIQLSKASLLTVLQEMQGSQLERLAVSGSEGMAVYQFTHLPDDLADRLRGVSDEMQSEGDERLAQRDLDVINLVSLLFQYILEDESLAGPMRGLIAHLQIPVLKAAMIDKRFFSKEGHPARLFLNTVSDACLGWQAHGDVEDDPLYIEIESLVRQLLASSDGSPEVFQEALDEFKQYLEQERRKADMVTQRVLDAQGSKEAAAVARAAVDKLLRDKLDAEGTPDVLKSLLEDGWSRVLFLQYVQHGGADSEAWKSAVEVVDNLLWSVQPISSPAHRDKLLSELPGLLEKLRKGLNQVGYNPYELKAQMQQLETVHLDRLKKIGVKDEAQPAKAAQQPKEPFEALDLGSLDESLDQKPPAGEKELEEAERRLARIQVGSWVEFKQDGDKALRCRLAAVIASTGRHIFVNRSGMKVAEYEKSDLVYKLATDQMSLLDDSMLFDRALESVISNMRDMKDKPI